MKKWYKITQANYSAPKYYCPAYKNSYCYAISAEHAICQKEMYGFDCQTSAEECDPNEVPYMTRALTEASTETLRDAIQSRGWKVTLS